MEIRSRKKSYEGASIQNLLVESKLYYRIINKFNANKEHLIANKLIFG